jgi:hypothetical protein
MDTSGVATRGQDAAPKIILKTGDEKFSLKNGIQSNHSSEK